jgi:hypothetical protein
LAGNIPENDSSQYFAMVTNSLKSILYMANDVWFSQKNIIFAMIFGKTCFRGPLVPYFVNWN